MHTLPDRRYIIVRDGLRPIRERRETSMFFTRIYRPIGIPSALEKRSTP
jgi:hypothetical protein